MAALRSMAVLGVPPEAALDELVRLAARTAGVPVGLLNLVDAERLWVKARHGTELQELPREITPCNYVVCDRTELEVADTRLDPRFEDNPLVTADDPLVFYAGYPLTTSDGYTVGTLCVLDSVPHVLDDEQRRALRVLAQLATAQLELRRLVTQQQDAARVRAREEDFVRAVLDSVSVGIVACDAQGRLQLFNPASKEFHGVDADADLTPELWSSHYDLFAADGRTPLAPEDVPLTRALVDGAVEGVEMVIRPRGLPARLVRCDGRALRDPEGRAAGAVVAMSDITTVRRAERSLQIAHDALSRSAQALLRSEEQFRGAFETGPMPMCRLDERGVFVHANPAMRRLLGLLGPDDLTGRTLTSFAAAADREQLDFSLAAADGTPEADYLEVRMRRDDGATVWCEVAVTAGSDLDGAGYRLVQLADIQDRKRREQELEHRVARDDLTGLANRMELHRRLAELLTSPHGPVGVLFLDLDGFKTVNDTAGHAVGDEVLVDVARRLRSLVRDEDLVARLGGDEFVLVRQDRDGLGEDRYPDLVARVRNAFRTPFFTSGGEQRVGVSVGLVIAQPGELASAVLSRADAVMYADKRRVDVPLQR